MSSVQKIIERPSGPYNLVTSLLDGSGFRLSECLNLRVGCFDFDTGILTVHDGKGRKDRPIQLPEKIMPERRTHLEEVAALHQEDLRAVTAGFSSKTQECRRDSDPFDRLRSIQ